MLSAEDGAVMRLASPSLGCFFALVRATLTLSEFGDVTIESPDTCGSTFLRDCFRVAESIIISGFISEVTKCRKYFFVTVFCGYLGFIIYAVVIAILILVNHGIQPFSLKQYVESYTNVSSH